MDYVGLDPTVGLECTDCRKIIRLTYSELLNRALDDHTLVCEGCHQPLDQGWTTVNLVQNIIRRRMQRSQSQPMSVAG